MDNATEFEKKLASLKNCRDIQRAPGTVDVSEYMRGMANGLILAVSVMEGGDPDYVDAPSKTTPTFEKALEHLINYHSMENDSDTPDFILAEYLKGCLDNFGKTLKARDKFYGESPESREAAAAPA